MKSSLKSLRGILLVLWFESVTVFSATIDPASFYQRSNDGSYRYGYSAGGGFNARQSATSANEVVGQYAQLLPDGRIVNVRYKAGVGGFQPTYGAASSAYNGATFGIPGSPGRLGGGAYSGGFLGAGPSGSRSFAGSPVQSISPGSLNTPASSIAESLNGGSLGAYSPGAGSYGGGSLSTTPSGSRSFAGGPPFSPGSFNGDGLAGGKLNGGASLGPGSSASRSPIGGSLGYTRPDLIGNRSPVSNGPVGRSYPGTGLTESLYGGFQYPGPRYAVAPAYNGDSNIQRRPPNTVAPVPRSLFMSTTPASVFNTGPQGDGSYRFSYANDNAARSESGDPSGTVRGTYSFQNDAGNHDLSYVAGSNTGFRPIGGSLAAPNGLSKQVPTTTTTTAPNTVSQSGPRNDGAYNFAYRTPDSTRQESADNRGNVQGSYSFRNENGDHDLSFVAGPNTGFRPTGGSLAVPNGLRQRTPLTSTSSVLPIDSTLDTNVVQNGSPGERSFQNEPDSAHNTLENSNRNDKNNGERQLSTTTLRPGSFRNSNGSPRYSLQNDGFGRQGSNGEESDVQSYIGHDNNGIQPVGANLVNTNRRSGDTASQTGSDRSNGRPYTSSGDNAFAYSRNNLRGSSGIMTNNVPSLDGGNGLAYGTGSGGLSSNGGSLANSFGVSGNGGQNLPTRSASTNGGSDGSYNYGAGSGSGLSRNGGSFGASGSGGQNQATRSASTNDGSDASYNYVAGSGNGLSSNGGSFANSFAKGGQNQMTRSASTYGGSDGSYNFSYDTGRQAHQESSDGRGRVDGRYSYQSSDGQRSLSYKVRPGTGFQVIGGNLASKTPK